jgi:sugar phosphate isomerase/epimerase
MFTTRLLLTRLVKTSIFFPLALAALVSLPTRLVATPIPEDAKVGGFAIGSQAWTFNHFSAFEAVEKTALAGGKVIELHPGDSLTREQRTVKFSHNSPDEVVAQMQTHLAKHGVRAINYGVVYAKGEAEWRRVFEFAKKLGLYAVTTEEVGQLDLLEKLAKEFDVRVAIHNHPRQPNDQKYRLWDPDYVLSLVKNRDARIGACADTGHWATSGITPLDGLKTLKGRIVSVHLKDRVAIAKETADVPFGAGICDVKAMLDELKAQGFAGNIAIEYEAHLANNVADVAQCIGYVRGYGSCGETRSR